MKEPQIGESLVQQVRYHDYVDGREVFLPRMLDASSYEMVFAARVITGRDIVLLTSGEWITFENWHYRKASSPQDHVHPMRVWSLDRMKNRYTILVPKEGEL